MHSVVGTEDLLFLQEGEHCTEGEKKSQLKIFSKDKTIRKAFQLYIHS